MAGKVTMAELARIAKVDVSTVSRALADSPRVRPETKTQIKALADRLGYEVNAAARNLRTRSTQTLGIVVPIDPTRGQTISDPFYLEMVGAVSNAASARDYDLLLTIPQSDGRVAEQRLLRAGKVDGLIVIGQAGRADRLNALAETTDKFVVWGGDLDGARYTVVGSDNRGGGRSAARHLLSTGRERILFAGDTALPEVTLRYQGLRDACEAAGRPHDESLVMRSSFGAMTVPQDIGAMLDTGVRFDAVFAASDVLALAILDALKARGIGVPNDVAIVGYDDIGQAALSRPALTTVSQDIKHGGAVMVDLLLRKIAGETPRSQLTTTQLIVRETSG